MISLSHEFCEPCLEIHSFFEIGIGTRNYPISEWEYDILYEELGN